MMGTFAPSDSALLLIDHQIGTMQAHQEHPAGGGERNTLALAKTAKILNIPVVLTSSQEQNLQGPLLPELQGNPARGLRGPSQAGRDRQCLERPELRRRRQEDQRTNLIMAGVTTDVCLVYPAISAFREGFNVQAVMDASGSPYDISEEMSRRRMETRRRRPDGHEHADGRTGAGLEPPGRRPIARHPVQRSVTKHRLTRRQLDRSGS